MIAREETHTYRWQEGEPLPAVMLAQELAAYLRCSVDAIYRLKREKRIRAIRGMKPLRFSVTEVRRFERGE